MTDDIPKGFEVLLTIDRCRVIALPQSIYDKRVHLINKVWLDFYNGELEDIEIQNKIMKILAGDFD